MSSIRCDDHIALLNSITGRMCVTNVQTINASRLAKQRKIALAHGWPLQPISLTGTDGDRSLVSIASKSRQVVTFHSAAPLM